MTPTLIYCAGGNRKYAEIALRHGYRYGAQLPDTTYYPLYFADQDYRRPRYVAYVRALKRTRPALATVLDWQHEDRLKEILMRAEEISQYTDEIMLIPKVPGGIAKLPRTVNGKPIRLGYSVATGYGETTVPIAEFGDWPVHLLGGKPSQQMALARQMNVVSVDGNYYQLKAQWAEFWVGLKEDGKDQWMQLKDVGLGDLTEANQRAFELSCMNIQAWWHGARVSVRWACDADVPAIVALARRQLGADYPIHYPALREGIARRELLVSFRGNAVTGFCLYYTRRDGWHTVRELAADEHRCGIGSTLLRHVPKPIRLKCVQSSPANAFYAHLGFKLTGTDEGKNQSLNVWEMTA